MATTTNQKAVGGGVAALVLVILGAVSQLEGGFVDHPDDPGGATNHGVTEAVARQHGYKDPMELLPKELATDILKQDYIVKPGFYPLIEIQPAVAHKLIDAGVNVGPSRPSRWFQQSLNSLSRGGRDFPQINVDGRIGPATIRTYQALEQKRGKVLACEMTIKLLDSYQAQHYVSLTNLHSFTPGWVSNRIGNVPLSQCTTYEAPR